MIGARHVLPGFLFAALFALPAAAQDANVGVLSGTLKKIKDTGTITLGYRESSLPFSYLNKRQQPIGYSIDLCREIVEEAATELDGMAIKIALAPVTAADRLDKEQSATAEGGGVLAGILRRRHQADGAEDLRGAVLSRPRRQDRRGDRRHHQRGGAAHVVRQAKARHHHRHGARSRPIAGHACRRQGRGLRHRRRTALWLHRHRAERPRHESGRRLSVLRSLWPRLSPRRPGLYRDRRARLCADGERAAARRALQQMVFAPAADRRDAQSADEPAARGDFPRPWCAGLTLSRNVLA